VADPVLVLLVGRGVARPDVDAGAARNHRAGRDLHAQRRAAGREERRDRQGEALDRGRVLIGDQRVVVVVVARRCTSGRRRRSGRSTGSRRCRSRPATPVVGGVGRELARIAVGRVPRRPSATGSPHWRPCRCRRTRGSRTGRRARTRSCCSCRSYRSPSAPGPPAAVVPARDRHLHPAVQVLAELRLKLALDVVLVDDIAFGGHARDDVLEVAVALLLPVAGEAELQVRRERAGDPRPPAGCGRSWPPWRGPRRRVPRSGAWR